MEKHALVKKKNDSICFYIPLHPDSMWYNVDFLAEFYWFGLILDWLPNSDWEPCLPCYLPRAEWEIRGFIPFLSVLVLCEMLAVLSKIWTRVAMSISYDDNHYTMGEGDISTLDGTPLKLVDKFTYLGSSVASTKKDIDTRLTKAWTAINRLSIIWKSDLTDKMKRSFFKAAVASILLNGCTTWTLIKRLKKKLDGNYTRMLRAILNKFWRQHPTRHQLYGHLPPITKTIQVRRTRHAGHCWRSRDELIRDVLLWTPTHGRSKAGRPARTYIQQLCEDRGCCAWGDERYGKVAREGQGYPCYQHDMMMNDDDDMEWKHTVSPVNKAFQTPCSVKKILLGYETIHHYWFH